MHKIGNVGGSGGRDVTSGAEREVDTGDAPPILHINWSSAAETVVFAVPASLSFSLMKRCGRNGGGVKEPRLERSVANGQSNDAFFIC